MTREEKSAIIEELKAKFAQNNYFYIIDASSMTVNQVNDFRKLCFQRGVEYKVVKNSLIKKALESLDTDYTPFYKEVLRNFSGIMFCKEAGSLPARLLKEFREKGNEKPILKGASIDSTLFIGEEHLETLTKIKSKQEMLGELVGLLQSPGTHLASTIQSVGAKLAGVLQTLVKNKEQ
ncbi:MAG: 50S ribosomal protein L10 [Microscillaceae bacterium]|nr:50S ribosomal protein L10 [Microscillaceae bacterium]MDW8460701.1 50S ribosomal protein L10 [Cytophagales bacterium]